MSLTDGRDRMKAEITSLRKKGNTAQADMLLEIFRLAFKSKINDVVLDEQVFDTYVEDYCKMYDKTLFDRYF